MADLGTAIQCLNDAKAKINRHIKAFDFVVGDQWSMSVKAARRDFTAKDNRDYTLTIGSVVDGTSMTAAWYTNTYEGGFDSWTLATSLSYPVTSLFYKDVTVPPLPGPYTESLSPYTDLSNVLAYNETAATWVPVTYVPAPPAGEVYVDVVTGAVEFNPDGVVISAGDVVKFIFNYVSSGVPHVSMPDQVSLGVRNFPQTGSGERYSTGDLFTFSATDTNQIDWSLRARTSETIPNDEIFQDGLGRITGVPTSWYLILSETPDLIRRVQDVSTGALLTHSQVMTSNNEPTNYIMFVNKPTNDVVVYYEYMGQEPSPGQYYYVTANRLRADVEYERPILYRTKDDMEFGLAPKSTDNHLWLGGDIAFDTNRLLRRLLLSGQGRWRKPGVQRRRLPTGNQLHREGP